MEAVIEAGATRVNIPDTVGYAMPEEFGALIRGVREKVQDINQAIYPVHCHNDLGLAVANALAAVRNGAGQVECTINGIGERAGNCSWKRWSWRSARERPTLTRIPDCPHRGDHPFERLVTKITGIQVQPNKAIVGPTPLRTSRASIRTACSRSVPRMRS